MRGFVAIENAKPTHNAAMTRLASVSLPSTNVRSQLSNVSASGTPMQMVTIAAPTNRRTRTVRV